MKVLKVPRMRKVSELQMKVLQLASSQSPFLRVLLLLEQVPVLTQVQQAYSGEVEQVSGG